ncbi:hypothetical protein C8J57DRAFT_1454889 [Mycena rebaudengoi]|nr:hypothetical protein C8J57DRAFT_1454889 [Mycena rebaudengoi]
MLIPFISTPRRLGRRKGGGKTGGSTGGSSSGGKGSSGSTGTGSSSSGGKGSSSGSGSSSSSGRGSSSSSGKSSPIKFGGGSSRSSRNYGRGGGRPSTIPAGSLFAGRSQGGGTRAQVFGTRSYGSGYPGISGRGVGGRGFPFYFWPLMWGGGIGYGSNAYLHSNEYGEPNNNSRPGGAMASAAFQSNSTGTVFRLVADNSTVSDLMADIAANCSSHLTAPNTTLPTPFDANAAPKPEQVVQYYRASSVALSLDGYNNTAALMDENAAPDAPLPAGIDAVLLDCLNQTVGLGVPLIDGAAALSPPHFGILALVYLVLKLSAL